MIASANIDSNVNLFIYHFLIRVVIPTSERIGHSVFEGIYRISSIATPNFKFRVTSNLLSLINQQIKLSKKSCLLESFKAKRVGQGKRRHSGHRYLIFDATKRPIL